VAENAATPLSFRITRLEKYLKTGDIVIMPLEWAYYTRTSIPSDFTEEVAVTGYLSEFYYSLPNTAEKFMFFVRNVNIGQIVSGTKRRYALTSNANIRKSYQRVMEEKFNWSGVTQNSPQNRTRHFGVKGVSCRDYILDPGGEIRDFVHLTAARLAELQKSRGVTIVLTWPAVAGTDCYNFDRTDLFVARLKAIFNNAGLIVVGDPRRSYFSEEHMLDTYYHVDIDAAYVRTRRLIEDIEAAGVISAGGERATKTLAAIDAAVLKKEEARLINNNSTIQLEQIVDGDYKIGQNEFDKYFYLSSMGWYDFEEWGVWSRGDTSEIVFRPHRSSPCEIIFTRNYFAQASASTIALNGVFVKIDDGQSILIPPSDQLAVITLKHQNVRSPMELGFSTDPRPLAFGLASIRVACAKPSVGVAGLFSPLGN
jgi:hypothetical protein